MVVEVMETRNGWPLGLGNINLRLRATLNFEAAAPANELSSEMPSPSPSFTSFSSSNLDTEFLGWYCFFSQYALVHSIILPRSECAAGTAYRNKTCEPRKFAVPEYK
ncbi:uncharacterized protein LOC113762082 isoform X3 [Coffea eugenioides]|uniref:Uncharacterized protein isoform X2 n=1 Tax=Coffea arabica TaxID=13443 RepID=A0A6P6VRX1_COFAR|nr:uncharacterized protein LOC113726064 isoform X3 [Coffea arabica]XP_027161141.1 uncharacterized protein LOC113762082 isoform X3 [Coffea eugenioides]